MMQNTYHYAILTCGTALILAGALPDRAHAQPPTLESESPRVDARQDHTPQTVVVDAKRAGMHLNLGRYDPRLLSPSAATYTADGSQIPSTRVSLLLEEDKQGPRIKWGPIIGGGVGALFGLTALLTFAHIGQKLGDALCSEPCTEGPKVEHYVLFMGGGAAAGALVGTAIDAVF